MQEEEEEVNSLCCLMFEAAVLLLFEGGVAMKAGVQERDRIFKVKITLK